MAERTAAADTFVAMLLHEANSTCSTARCQLSAPSPRSSPEYYSHGTIRRRPRSCPVADMMAFAGGREEPATLRTLTWILSPGPKPLSASNQKEWHVGLLFAP